ncbi:MAG: hypothetical protein ACRCX2_10385 [Paraclostridium sp.]
MATLEGTLTTGKKIVEGVYNNSISMISGLYDKYAVIPFGDLGFTPSKVIISIPGVRTLGTGGGIIGGDVSVDSSNKYGTFFGDIYPTRHTFTISSLTQSTCTLQISRVSANNNLELDKGIKWIAFE